MIRKRWETAKTERVVIASIKSAIGGEGHVLAQTAWPVVVICVGEKD